MFDFDKPTDRRGRNSYKWEVADGELPMWVADMDFETAPAVKQAIGRIAEHGIYGYSTLPDEYFTAVRDYHNRRHGSGFVTEHMVYSNGIVAAISSIVRRITNMGDNVVVLAPVYNIFYNSIINNGRVVLPSDLAYRDGVYSIDFSDLEAKLSLPETSLLIFCNPHNPTGNIWGVDELRRVGELAKRYGVKVISDEIHCDITRHGCPYTSFYAVSDTCREVSIVAVSASKTFNIAGLQSATLVISDPDLRYNVWRGLNNDEVGEPNIFSVSANVAAFTECDAWVDELCSYLFRNRDYAEARARDMGLLPVRADATYLLWVDISSLATDSVSFTEDLRKSTGLYVSEGREYGECGKSFIRINLATQRARVEDGLDRLAAYVRELREKASRKPD